MLEAHPRIDIGDHDAGATRRDIPGGLGVHGAGCRAGVLQIPLIEIERIVGHSMDVAPLIRFGVYHLWVGPQSRERCR